MEILATEHSHKDVVCSGRQSDNLVTKSAAVQVNRTARKEAAEVDNPRRQSPPCFWCSANMAATVRRTNTIVVPALTAPIDRDSSLTVRCLSSKEEMLTSGQSARFRENMNAPIPKSSRSWGTDSSSTTLAYVTRCNA